VTLPLDGFAQWSAIAKGEPSARATIVHNVPKTGYAGAIRQGDLKLLFDGMQTEGSNAVLRSRYPPFGFVPATPDVFPEGVNITLNTTGPEGGAKPIKTWLFNITNVSECINSSLLIAVY
jgi:hypothetical protein